MYVFLRNVVLRIISLLSATAKGIMNYLDLVSMEEKQLTEIYCSIGSSEWFAKVNFLMYHVNHEYKH